MEDSSNKNEKRKIPNTVAILVLGISSILTSIFLIGIIFGVIGLYLSTKSRIKFKENPNLYLGYGKLKMGRVMSFLGIIFSTLWFLLIVLGLSSGLS